MNKFVEIQQTVQAKQFEIRYFDLTNKIHYNRHRYASNDGEQTTQKIT